MFYVYVLRSLRNGKRYVGVTRKGVEERLRQHRSGSSQWTRQNSPFVLLHVEDLVDLTQARRRERFMKSGQGRKWFDTRFPRSSVGRAGDC